MAASSRLPKVRLGAVIAIGVAAGLGVWLATRDSGSSSPPTSTPTTAAGATGSKVVPITPGGLQTLVGALQRPIYWAGEESGKTYELTQSADGKVYLRYLPHGVAVGTQKAELTVGTYPVASAFSVTQRGAERSGSVRVPARGAVAFYNKNTPTNIYIAFPGTDYQIEVYDPSAAEAKRARPHGEDRACRGDSPLDLRSTRARVPGQAEGGRPLARPSALLGRVHARHRLRARADARATRPSSATCRRARRRARTCWR